MDINTKKDMKLTWLFREDMVNSQVIEYLLHKTFHGMETAGKLLNLFNEANVTYTSAENWNWKLLSYVFATPWTVQSMEFSRPEYWNG